MAEPLPEIYRSLRWQVFLVLLVAVLAVFATGALLLLAPQEYLVIGVPVVLVLEFLCGFLLAGKMMALALARHHERLREQLVQQQEQTKKTLVARWLSLDSAERDRLREKFPDVDWNAIDGLAGTAAEPQTKH
jgi:low affinity Fe/Cu permease